MVIDRHMLRKFGMDADMQSASEIDYRMIQAINSLLSTENYIVDGQLDSFTPPAIQALLWGHQRYSGNTASKITNEGSFDSSWNQYLSMFSKEGAHFLLIVFSSCPISLKIHF